ncbi:2TM domain-containing protein [Chryseobacterium sp. FH1]|uniref:2TM domain-containing protein n=1 Tax=Chryseobacterium sp. FH1 TaxID=1233951 RepID=UPI0004E3BA11|nr:2TM domain-containing protein [Chryseobacterium sp. FH1]KFC24265.1 histidine kinase [Chryseobacterium sp. FH1]
MNKKSIISLFWVAFGVNIFFFILDTDEKTVENFFFGLLVCLMYSFFIGLSNGFTNEQLNKKFSWTEQTRTRVTLGIILVIVVNVVVSYLCGYINFVLIQKTATTETFFSVKYSFVNWFTINIALLISAFLHAKGFMEELKKTSKKEVVQQKLIANSANAQFESLKNQLDPHFLFNSLNVLSALIDENPNQAQKFTSSMSKIYRYVLEQKDKELVTVSDEIEFAKTYCNLLKTRFEDSVDFEFEVKIEDEQKFVVPLSLQLLLENCIKHNFATSSKPLIIKIYSEDSYLSIENNLQKREQLKESAGIGLANIVQRYSLLTDQNVFVEESESNFKVKIPILTEKKSQKMNTYISPDTENIAYERAVKRVKELKGFYGNLISYCIVIPFLIIINLLTSPDHIWFYWAMLGWGIGVVAHAMNVFAIGKNWEEKKIQEIMSKDNFGK